MKNLGRIYKDIKDVRIQGATNIAKAAIKAYFMKPDAENKRNLINLRPTEPMLVNALRYLELWSKEKILVHFNESQRKINQYACSLIKDNSIIYTHCHSTNVINSLVYAKKQGKIFEVYNTETRPLYQGRLTSKELDSNGIKVTEYIDSAFKIAIKKSDIIMIGADAILKSGIINKIGSGVIAEIAWIHKKPLYIIADSWKFSPKHVKIEERDFHEVWKNAPPHIKIKDPAFEKVEKKYIKGIISEFGILSFNDFIAKASKNLQVKNN